ncbi:MAG: flagellar filament capping protein FliD [Pseudomonadota bacterium]
MISVPGIGSGLDINAIVNGLVAAEGDAKTQLLATERANIETEISAFGSLKSIVSTFQNSSSTLATASTFTATQASSEDNTFFTASAAASVAAGAFTIEIQSLAEAQKLITTGFADADTDVGTGTLTISVAGESFDVVIDTENQTLAGIRDAINNATDNTSVTATILTVDDGASGTEAKLVLTSINTGTDNEITITVADDDLANTDNSGLSIFYYDTSDGTTPEQLSITNAAVDADLYIDGQRVLSSSNTISDAIEGVTLSLLKAETGVENTLSISQDNSAITSAIEIFISNYNSFISFTNSLTAFDVEAQTAGILIGDSTIRTLTNAVRLEVNSNVSGISGTLDSLVELGITSDSNGQLQIDSAALQEILTSDRDSVAELFSSADGLATRLSSLLDEYAKSDGIIDNKTQGLNDTVDDINDDLQALQLRLDALEARLLAEFTALDLLITQLNSTSTFLTQQFEQISSITQSQNGN